jgi:excisionase family DNA binding protein
MDTSPTTQLAPLLTSDEAAAILRCSRRALMRLVAQHEFRTVSLTGRTVPYGSTRAT